MYRFLFLGDSITDADHLFTTDNLGRGYVAKLAKMPRFQKDFFCNRGHDGFTSESILRLLKRDGIESGWDVITLLAGVNDVTVEVYTDRPRIPQEFTAYYREILDLLRPACRHLILAEPFLFDEPAAFSSWHPYIEAESRIIQDLAGTYGAVFLPLDQKLRTEARIQGVHQITTDGIHLTGRGNQLLADAWIRSFETLCQGSAE